LNTCKAERHKLQFYRFCPHEKASNIDTFLRIDRALRLYLKQSQFLTFSFPVFAHSSVTSLFLRKTLFPMLPKLLVHICWVWGLEVYWIDSSCCNFRVLIFRLSNFTGIIFFVVFSFFYLLLVRVHLGLSLYVSILFLFKQIPIFSVCLTQEFCHFFQCSSLPFSKSVTVMTGVGSLFSYM